MFTLFVAALHYAREGHIQQGCSALVVDFSAHAAVSIECVCSQEKVKFNF